MKQTIQLENLSCQNCVKHVTQHFLSMEGVSDGGGLRTADSPSHD